MRVITAKRIWDAKIRWPQSAGPLDDGYRKIKVLAPADFAAMKSVFPSIDTVGSLHVFNIGGNKIRLIALVRYGTQRLYIRDGLDHREYDKAKWKE